MVMKENLHSISDCKMYCVSPGRETECAEFFNDFVQNFEKLGLLVGFFFPEKSYYLLKYFIPKIILLSLYWWLIISSRG